MYRRERNEYTRLLLQQLKTGKLESPFTEKPPSGLLQMPSRSPSSSHDQLNELDSLLTSVLLPSDTHSPAARTRGSPQHHKHTDSTRLSASQVHEDSTSALRQRSEQRRSNLSSQRQEDLSSGDHYTTTQAGARIPLRVGTSRSLESHLHTSGSTGSGGATDDGGGSSKHRRVPGRVHYSDSVLYLGNQHRTSPVKALSHDRIQTNLPNGIGSLSSSDHKYVGVLHRAPTAHSPSHGHRLNHRQPSSPTRHNAREGRIFTREEDRDDGDVLMVGDLDVSPLSLSDDLMGGESYSELQDDGDLSDISELLQTTPQAKLTSVSVHQTLMTMRKYTGNHIV